MTLCTSHACSALCSWLKMGNAVNTASATVKSGTIAIAALKAVPLCFPLAGLLRRRMYTYRWLSLLVWLYFIDGVVRAWSDRGLSAQLALAEVLLCLLLFAACAMHVRIRLKSTHDPAS